MSAARPRRHRTVRGKPSAALDGLFAATKVYLESIGWTTVLAGPVRVQSELGAPRMRYTLAIDFLGGPRASRRARARR